MLWKPALTGTVLTQRIASIIKSRGVGPNVSKQQAAYLHRPDVNICSFLKQAGCRAALDKRLACRFWFWNGFLRVFQDPAEPGQNSQESPPQKKTR